MSALYVRTSFRAAVDGLLAARGFAYVESVNAATKTKVLPPRWYTLDFTGASDQRMSLGLPGLFRETGVASVLVHTEHNIGDGEAIDAADAVRNSLCNFVDATGELHVDDAQPPVDLDGGDFFGSFYRVGVDLRYHFNRLA